MKIRNRRDKPHIGPDRKVTNIQWVNNLRGVRVPYKPTPSGMLYVPVGALDRWRLAINFTEDQI